MKKAKTIYQTPALKCFCAMVNGHILVASGDFSGSTTEVDDNDNRFGGTTPDVDYD